MAKNLWGNIYYKDTFAGRLEERPGGRYIFSYDASYLDSGLPAIAYTLPLKEGPFISEAGLHPYFDNLVAEGWLCNAQAKALSVSSSNRFALLLGFGHDLMGAVSVVDPVQTKIAQSSYSEITTKIALHSRASLSGVQRKLLLAKDGSSYRPIEPPELSTHIAKLAFGNLSELLELEYLTTQVCRLFLDKDEVVDASICHLDFIGENALIIPRFDRSPTGRRSHHFEEFNQLLGKSSGDSKYEGSYEEMGQFVGSVSSLPRLEQEKLLKRILVCFLVGNTDAHFKNFAMFHTPEGLRLTPAYDLVASCVYPEFQSIALSVAGASDLSIGKLESRHLRKLTIGFGLPEQSLFMIADEIEKQFHQAVHFLETATIGSESLRKKIIEKMEKRWNGSFKLIGPRS